MAIELVKNKKHLVVKRDGRIEEYDEEKMRKVLKWACNNREWMVEEILNDVQIKIYDKIHIAKLFDEVINTVTNKISLLYPIWDEVAKNLLIQKYYKEVWGIKRDEYPDYLEVIKKALKYNIYKKEIIDTFSKEELEELGSYINPKRDFLFTFGGLELFMNKYVKRYTKNKMLELPQHAYMRVAIQLHYKDKDRLKRIKEKYDMLSLHKIAPATPIMLNSLSDVFNATSCVLIQTDDDSESIMETARSMAIYSKNASGLGVDISRIRALGSSIGKDGVSSGVIPFIKVFESIVSSWNQKSARVGAAAIYYPFWHLDSERITLLKDAGGNDDERARKLKYAIKWNSVFTDAIINDDYIYLFDPKDTPELLDTYGEEFKKWYKHYSEKQGIRKKKIKARELAYLVAKIRSETGNLYWFSVDNANKFRVTRDFINQGNLCCSEVLLPTKPLKLNKIKFIKDVETGVIKEVREYDGEIGICNLTSINLLAWDEMNRKEKDKFIYSLLLGMDNAIEYADYPVKAGERFNKLHRAIGIGITNYHNWLASQRIKFSDEKAKEVTHYVMEDIYFYLVKNSIELAKQRGKYYYYDGSLWSKGKFGWELYEEYFKEIEKELGTKLNYPLKHNWDNLRVEMVKYGVRFELLMSIPPGATSSAVLNFTEGIEPIRELKITKEGTYTLPFIVPNLQKNRMYYEKAWEIPTKQILELAAIRQKFLDQSQSLNLYQINPDSAFDIINDIVYAEKLGIKSLYYFNSLKKGDIEEVCEGCAV